MVDNRQEMADKLFQAMDIITSKRLSSLAFDTTSVCTIEEIENLKEGAYRVFDGSSRFTAYAPDEKEYSVNQRVYVKIPNGDYDAYKIITGPYVGKNDNSIAYISPFNQFIDVSGDLVQDDIECGLTANNMDESAIHIWSSDSFDYQGFNRLGISAEFMTFLNQSTIEGQYGLCLRLFTESKTGAGEVYSFYLDSSDMYGNPYNYSAYFKQEQLYDISGLYKIKRAELYFYQKNNFILRDGTYLNYKTDNIFVNNIYVAFGYDATAFNTDTILLTTNSPLTYSNKKPSNIKKVELRWIHINDEEKAYVIDTEAEIPSNATITWYRLTDTENNENPTDPFWHQVETDDRMKYQFEPDYNINRNGVKVIIEFPNAASITNSLKTSHALSLLIEDCKQQISNTTISSAVQNALDNLLQIENLEELSSYFKEQVLNQLGDFQDEVLPSATAVYDYIIEQREQTRYYYSEPLYFDSEDSQAQDITNTLQALTIEVDPEGYKGIYNLYDETKNLINATESYRLRNLTAKYKTLDKLQSAESITWYFPKVSTMIQAPELGKEYNEGDEYITDASDLGHPGYCAIRRKGIETTEELPEGVQFIDLNQKFRIKDYYLNSANNNMIFCEVVRNRLTYSTSTILLFGPAGSNGTKATLKVRMLQDGEEVNAITISDKQDSIVEFKVELYDYNNNLVNNINPGFSWFSQGEARLNLDVAAGVINIGTPHSLNEYAGFILKTSVPWQGITLESLTPIAFKTSQSSFAAFEGATHIVYDSSGARPSFYKAPYKLYDIDWNLQTNVEWRGHVKDVDLTDTESKSARFYPTIVNDIIVPTVMYYTGIETYSVIARANDADVWVQPIVICQNQYESTVLNEWTGDLTIDEKNGIILSTVVGAGVKNHDNTFSGVLMGDVGSVEDSSNHSGLGLYGFHKGAQSFGFNVDGTAFLGKSGSGRITFNGNKGIIQSANYDGTYGTHLDLDDSILHLYGSSGKIAFDTSTNSTSLMEISTGDSTLISIAKDNYFLQTANYTDSSGTKFDLLNSTLSMHGKGGNLFINTSAQDTLFKINNSNGVCLMNIGDEYYLCSSNYATGEGKQTAGTIFNIGEGYINSVASKGAVLISTRNEDPYFQITNSAKPLVYMAAASQYICSSNYTTNEAGQHIIGTIFNISEGYIRSASEMGSILISTQGNEPYFQITHQDKSLIHMASDYQYMCSSNYATNESGQQSAGTIFNIGEGYIKSVLGKSSVLISTKEEEPYFLISSTSGTDLIKISQQEAIIQTAGYTDNITGARLDLSSGGFNINGFSEEGFLKIGTVETDTPINVNDTFKVSWDGYIEAQGELTIPSGQIGGWSINAFGIYNVSAIEQNGTYIYGDGMQLYSGNKIAEGENAIRRIIVGDFDSIGSDSNAPTLNMGNPYFIVRNDGSMVCNSASFNYGTINQAAISEGTISKAAISEGTIVNAAINNATIKSGTIDAVTITGNCTVNGTFSGGTISGSTFTGGSISVDGLITCQGLHIGEANYEPRIYGANFLITSMSGEGNLSSSANILTDESSISLNSTKPEKIYTGLSNSDLSINGSVEVEGIWYNFTAKLPTHQHEITTLPNIPTSVSFNKKSIYVQNKRVFSGVRLLGDKVGE